MIGPRQDVPGLRSPLDDLFESREAQSEVQVSLIFWQNDLPFPLSSFARTILFLISQGQPGGQFHQWFSRLK